MSPCEHCGSPFQPESDRDRFCCKGCECVHELIHESGFDRFYELRRNELITPVRGRPFEVHDFAWLEEAVASAGDHGAVAELDCQLEGLSCVACVWLVEQLFERHPGAVRCVSNPARGTLHLEWRRGECDLTAFARQLLSFGYTMTPRQASRPRDDQGLAARTGLCAAFALNAMGFTLPVYLGMPDDFEFAGLFRLITFLSATLAMLVGGSWFIMRAWRALRHRSIHIDLPIALGLIAAYLGSIAGWVLGEQQLLYFDFVCTFVFLMLGGRLLQTLAVERNRHRLARRSVVPERLDDGREGIPREALKAGDRFELPAGRALPVAASLVEGDGEISLEWIRGERDPVGIAPGQVLPAGAIALSRKPLKLCAREDWAESSLSRLLADIPVEKGSRSLQRLLRGYLLAIVGIGILALFGWARVGQATTGMQAMISVFVVSCPCALGVAIPFADERAAKLAVRAGVFVRNASLWRRLRQVRRVVFDKTGTLTLERPVLDNPEDAESLAPEAVRALAALCAGSCHPVARSLLEALGSRGQRALAEIRTEPVEEEPGSGVEGRIGDSVWSLGRAGWRALGDPECTVLARDGRNIAGFRFTDRLRPDTRMVIDSLRAAGFEIRILSGDHPEKVRRMAEELGIDPRLAEGWMSPDDKAARLAEIDRDDSLFLGDGANDSLAFDRALVTGTPVADLSLLERKADFFTLGNGLDWLPGMFSIAAARERGIRRAFGFTLVYNLAAISVCLAGHMSPLVAAILMPLSSIISLLLVSTSKAAPGARLAQIPQRPLPSPVVSPVQVTES